ncbi:MAG: NADPH-dependent glutamate synthase [Thermoplasmatota archaeon]
MENDVKYLMFKTKLNTYCPHCNMGFNIKEEDGEWTHLKAEKDEKELDIRLSPYLDVFDKEMSIPIKEGELVDKFICPHCKSSLMIEDKLCEECGSPLAELIISAYSKLIPFFLCSRNGCEWHGLTKADEAKIKLKIPRQTMPEQDQKIRVHNFQEVPYGLTSELAELEAGRCLQCTNPRCVEGCPVGVDIPAFIKLIREDDILGSYEKIKEKNLLPAVCGRVCPQEDQCEGKCVLGIRDVPVAIGNLERYVADFVRKMDLERRPDKIEIKNEKVAVIGSGPGGLTCAYDLTLLGYQVTIFEAFHNTGGVLVYGIPEFRLPKAIVKHEIEFLKRLGCKIETNQVIGKIKTIDELLEDFDAVYIGVGAGLPRFMDIEGENFCNIVSANEYLTRINLMKAYRFPNYDTPLPQGEKVVVIGGGNVAMDAARSSKRAGSDVTIVYRRSRKELPARNDEIHHAEQEGVKFKLLTNPVKFIGDDRGWVKGVECVRMKLGEPDESGRRKPIEIEGSNFLVDCDLVIVAIGAGPNPILFESTPDLKRNKWGYIEVDPDTMETSKKNVFAGGDIVTGSATVIQAMGAGRTAASAIHDRLQGRKKKGKKK